MINNQWHQYNPVKIVSGPGTLSTLATHVRDYERVLLVTTGGFTRRGLTKNILDQVGANKVIVLDSVMPNPDLEYIDEAVEKLKAKDINAIIAVGGGSVIDTAKAISVTLASGLVNPLQKIFRSGFVFEWNKNLPLIAVPTTSGTGAEVTPFATVWDAMGKKKHSIMSELIYPRIAVLDPELTLSLPSNETLFTALDSISHSLESLWNKNRTLMSEMYATNSLVLSNQALPKVLKEPDNLIARQSMQQASMLAGLAISQTRTALAHSISYPLTIYYGVPHGLACSFTLEKIITQYLVSYPNEKFATLMMDTGHLLKSLNLRKLLNKYVSDEQIIELEDQMLTPGRADNFLCDPKGVKHAMSQALKL